MAQIKIEWPAPPVDGAEVKFRAPCDCAQGTGLLLCYPDAAGEETSKEFTFYDAHGNDLTGLGNLFGAGAYVKVILDTGNGRAYIQNAATNGYLETLGGFVLTDIIVPDSAWEPGGLDGYPYRAAIELAGMTKDHFVDVYFEETTTAQVSPVAESYDGGFYIFAAKYPETLVRIETVNCTPNKNDKIKNKVFGVISVTYAAGNVCTCSDGVITLTAKTNNGRWEFGVPHAGEWVVSDGETSQIVNITTQGQSESVEIISELWLFKNGNEYTDITGGWQVIAAANKNNGCLNITGYAGNGANSIETNNVIDLSKYNTLAVHMVSNTMSDWFILAVGAKGTIAGSGAVPPATQLIINDQTTGWVYLDISNISSGIIMLRANETGSVATDQIYATKAVLT